MNLETGDYIIIRGWDKTNFFRNQWYTKLENKPTRVWVWGNGKIYVAHPDLDLIPLEDDAVYDKVKDADNLPNHFEYKSKVKEFDKISSNRPIPDERPLLKFLRKKDIKEEEEHEKKLSPNDLKILNMIDKINDGEMELSMIEKLFGSLESFISFISKKGFLYHLDPFQQEFADIQNSLLYAYVQNDPDFVYEIALKYMNGITKVGEDYYYDADYSDLADLFKTGRDISEKTIESILSGEYDSWNYGSYDTDDEYRDVYSDLDHYAKSVVDEHIVNELKAMGTLKFQYSNYRRRLPDLLSVIAEEQGTEEEFKLTDEVITRLMSDEESLKFLINRELDDVRSNLSSIYSMCYGDVLSSEWYNDIWSELVGEIVDSKDGEDYSYEKSVWLKDGTRGKKTAYGRRYKVTNCLKNIIKDWLEVNKNKNGYNNNTIEYFGSYTGLIKDAMEYGPMDWLDVPRFDDYPDWRKLNKCMSENVESYF
jgi:hypothetical protein